LMPAACRISHTVEGAAVMPSFASSPWIRRCPHSGFSFGAHRQPLAPEADLSPPGVARLAIEVLDRLEVPSAVLVGNDSGGVIAQLVASAHPGACRRWYWWPVTPSNASRPVPTATCSALPPSPAPCASSPGP
jgi:hypothetical protein